MRILGIDVGTTSIKLVEVDSAFGRYEIHDYHEIATRPDRTAAQLVADWYAELPRKPDRVVASIRTGQTTFRNLSLPTRDKRAIASGLEFELEDELPINMDEALTDYAPLSQGKWGTDLHVAITRSAIVETEIARWKEAGLEPDVITTEAWAYRGYLNRVLSPDRTDEPTLLVHIGHTHTNLHVQWRGRPILCRELAWGGSQLTKAICIRYQIPMDQAETAKIDHGFIVSSESTQTLTADQKHFSDTLNEALQSLYSEIRQINLATKALTQKNLSHVMLSGGSTLLPGLAQASAEALRLPVSLARGISAVAPSGVNYSEPTDARFLLATALALLWVGPAKNSLLNFRRGALAKASKTRSFEWRHFQKPIATAAAVLLVMITSLITQRIVYQGRLKTIDAQLEQAVRRSFSTLTNSQVKNYIKNPKTLRVAIEKELKRGRDLSQLLDGNKKAPVRFLKSLSQGIPKDVVVDLTRFQVGAAPDQSYLSQPPQTVSLTFLYSNPQTSEKLQTLLTPRIDNLTKSAVDEIPSPDGNGKKWRVTFTGTPTEDSYVR